MRDGGYAATRQRPDQASGQDPFHSLTKRHILIQYGYVVAHLESLGEHLLSTLKTHHTKGAFEELLTRLHKEPKGDPFSQYFHEGVRCSVLSGLLNSPAVHAGLAVLVGVDVATHH